MNNLVYKYASIVWLQLSIDKYGLDSLQIVVFYFLEVPDSDYLKTLRDIENNLLIDMFPNGISLIVPPLH